MRLPRRSAPRNDKLFNYYHPSLICPFAYLHIIFKNRIFV